MRGKAVMKFSDPSTLPPSLWAHSATPAPETSRLESSLSAAVAIIGGGFTGLSAALRLAELGSEAVVVEAAEPGWGASGRNGGQVNAGFKHDPEAMLATFGQERGERLIEFGGSTTQVVFDLIERYAIDCHANRAGWLQLVHSPKALPEVESRARQWQDRGVAVRLLDRAETERMTGSPLYPAALLDPRCGTVQPLSYARGLARAALSQGAKIFSQSPALSLDREGRKWRVKTSEGEVLADEVLIATNGYSGDLWPGLRQTVIDANSFIVATEPLSANLRRSILPEGQATSDTKRLLHYLRLDPEGRLLIGGRGSFSDPSRVNDFAHLEDIAPKLFPQLGQISIAFRWSGRIAITQDHYPHLHQPAPGVTIALGYNGRGVAMATALGRSLGEALHAGSLEPCPLPVSAVQPIPAHGLRRLMIGGMAAYYAFRDRMESNAI